MIRVRDIRVALTDNRRLEEIAATFLNIHIDAIRNARVIKKAIDARRRGGSPIFIIYDLDLVLNIDEKRIVKKFKRTKNVERIEDTTLSFEINLKFGSEGKNPPVVVGFGPAGMFAALMLARVGLCPIVLERGAAVDDRQKAVDLFFSQGKLDVNANIQFGEGGAGTFSDGKLTARNVPNLGEIIIEDFIKFGAPEEIRYLQKPHIGTDNLKNIVKNLRAEIIKLGGSVRFLSKATDIEIENGKVKAVVVNNEERLKTDTIFLGIGHSARDTYKMLYEKGIKMESKAFAVGVRIEHPQEFIDKAQYGEDYKNTKLPRASYALTYKDTTGRGVYSFCMCPGGQVINAASDYNQTVTNGMSNFKRDSGIANSAIVVTVSGEDFARYGKSPLSGVYFQEKIEKKAFVCGGGLAPVMSVGDFLSGKRGGEIFWTKPTFLPGVVSKDFGEILPIFITEPLKRGLLHFDSKIKDFARGDVCMTGVETRTSSPVRIVRDKDKRQSVSVSGLFPIGEGAGYAGGIMSSAADGLKSVETYLQEFQKLRNGLMIAEE